VWPLRPSPIVALLRERRVPSSIGMQVWAGFMLPLSALRVGRRLAQWVAMHWASQLSSRVSGDAPAMVSEPPSTSAPDTEGAPGTNIANIPHTLIDGCTNDGASTTALQPVLSPGSMSRSAEALPAPAVQRAQVGDGAASPHPAHCSQPSLCGQVMEALVVVAAAAFFAAAVGGPVALGWPALAFTSAFGAIGAYLRYVLARLFNTGVLGTFPVGTFAANTIATGVYGVSSTLSKFSVPYDDMLTQAVLFGVQYGFCGCLSTMSSLVLEFHRLPGGAAVRYALATIVVGQVVTLLTIGAPTFGPLRSAIIIPPPVDACLAFSDLCSVLLTSIQCPAADVAMNACRPNGISDFVGVCNCGGIAAFDASRRIAELIIDGQAASNVSWSLAPVWPARGGGQTVGSAALGGIGAWPTDVVDACLSFDNLCDHVLHRISCPRDQRIAASCDRRGLVNFRVATCRCGSFDAGTAHVLELIVDAQVYSDKSVSDLRGYPSSPPLEFGPAYEQLCHRSLAHVQCPPHAMHVAGTPPGGNISVFVGECWCHVANGWDLSGWWRTGEKC
jgi:fluoride ion exporter CrcB/FEX